MTEPGRRRLSGKAAIVTGSGRGIGTAIARRSLDILVYNAGIFSYAPLERMAAGVSLKRWGRHREVAYAMVFLASEDAAYITGQPLLTDCGATLTMFQG